MFNLEQAIAEWRRKMTEAGIKTPVPLEELESHLREEFEAQMSSGVVPERAFEIAVSRLGAPATLRKEFGNVGDVMKPWERKLSRVVSVGGGTALGLTGLRLMWVPLHTGAGMAHAQAVEFTSIAGAFLCGALVLCLWPVSWRFFPVLLRKPTRLAVELLCLIVSGAFGAMLLRLFTLIGVTYEGIVVPIVWALILPLAIGAALVFGLEEAAYRGAKRPA